MTALSRNFILIGSLVGLTHRSVTLMSLTDGVRVIGLGGNGFRRTDVGHGHRNTGVVRRAVSEFAVEVCSPCQSAPELIEWAQRVREQIEREAKARQAAIAGLFGSVALSTEVEGKATSRRGRGAGTDQ